MENYFEFVSNELLSKLNQIKEFVKRHNPTIGILTEEVLRDFLRRHLPNFVSVEQGFIIQKNGILSKQSDIIIYNSHLFAPFYRLNDIVIVPVESVIAIIEVKTTITKKIFHQAIEYFENIKAITQCPCFLFIYNSETIDKISDYFHSYKHKNNRVEFDHDTFQFLPDEITGINTSFHLKKDYVSNDRDSAGYSSFFYENMDGTEINALQHFYLSIYHLVEKEAEFSQMRESYFPQKFSHYKAIELFDM